jgi:hypothetical protein
MTPHIGTARPALSQISPGNTRRRHHGVMLASLALAAIALMASAAAQAATDYPICLRVYGAPTYDECYYTTMETCRSSASGRSAQCYINPFYQGAGARQAMPRRYAR